MNGWNMKQMAILLTYCTRLFTGIDGALIMRNNVLKYMKSDMHITVVNIEKKKKDNLLLQMPIEKSVMEV